MLVWGRSQGKPTFQREVSESQRQPLRPETGRLRFETLKFPGATPTQPSSRLPRAGRRTRCCCCAVRSRAEELLVPEQRMCPDDFLLSAWSLRLLFLWRSAWGRQLRPRLCPAPPQTQKVWIFPSGWGFAPPHPHPPPPHPRPARTASFELSQCMKVGSVTFGVGVD